LIYASYHDFVDSVESVGAIPPQEIFENSCEVLLAKCRYLKREMDLSGLGRSNSTDI